jgi:uncharacterized protein (DUF2252 family)
MAKQDARETMQASKAAGKSLRVKVPRASHAHWRPQSKGRDVVAMLEASNRGRVPTLIPVRYGRMLHSPFSFLRGAAAIMAGDLARTAVSGIRVQACGDAHLLNFGGFATPERHLIFDVNDFDETLPGPWEWDIKRLAASVILAARYLALPRARCIEATMTSVTAYREHMALYAGMGALERWYQRIDATTVAELALSAKGGSTAVPFHPVTEHLFPKFTEAVGASLRLKDEPPLIFHPRKGDHTIDHVRQFLAQYRKTLPDDRRALLDQYMLVDVVLKVVGVGSVGTRCAVALLMARDGDSLFLQFKEARASVLEPYTQRSRYPNHGQRVVEGQRLMQSASDIFLGWSRIPNLKAGFYVRQLRDRKTSANVDTMNGRHLIDYARHCGQALARAHAKAGDAAAISGYLGRGDSFAVALTRFAAAYADQTEADFTTLRAAAKAGRIPVEDL